MTNSKDVKPIVIHIGTKKALDDAKAVSYETYDGTIRRGLEALNELKKLRGS
jgi:hypothetical protein